MDRQWDDGSPQFTAFPPPLDVSDLDVEGAILASTMDVSSVMDVDPLVVLRRDDWEAIDVDDLSEMSDIEEGESESREQTGQSSYMAMQVDVEDLLEEHSNKCQESPELVSRQRLDRLEQAFEEKVNRYTFPPVRFATKPSSVDEPVPNLPPHLNPALYAHQNQLAKMASEVDELTSSVGQIKEKISSLRVKIQEHENKTDRHILAAWESQKLTQLETAHVVDTSIRPLWSKALAKLPAAVLGIYVILVILYLLTGASRSSCNFLLMALPIIFQAAFSSYFDLSGLDDKLKPDIRHLFDPQTHDIRDAITALQLDPETRIYATCPQCCCIYPPSNGRNRYPKVCTYQPTPRSKACGSRLLRRDDRTAPIRPYCYQPMAKWLSCFLSRPDILKELDRQTVAWKAGSIKECCKDIFFSPVLRSFRGFDQTPFLDAPKDEMRLVFGLNVDWFNPYGNKVSGKHISIGGIYLVCMNLPPHLRYKAENIYLVGILPGPREPSLHQLNHFTRPLVDDLLQLWDPGVIFSNLPQYPLGCLLRVALIALIADLMAIRKMAGMMSVSSKDHFCSFCRQSKTDISNFEVDQWDRWTSASFREAAEAWKNAESDAEQKKLYSANGIYYSELLRLPYWEPIQFTLLDAMHNLFLGDLKKHCRDYLGMTAQATKSSGNTQISPHSTEDQQLFLDEIKSILLRETVGRKDSLFRSIRKTYILAYVEANNLAPKAATMTKAELVSLLRNWNCSDINIIRHPQPFPEPVVSLQEPVDEDVVILDVLTIGQIVVDMEKTVTPSWLTSAPRTLGDPGYGKLTADQWRTVCTINMIITLIRIWKPDTERLPYLENFIHLVTAIRWATMRTTSAKQVAIVRNHFKRYCETTVELFGTTSLVPNTHMSLHLAECIQSFGPVHGWWAFPFERYNGIIQRQNSNHKLGELEVTFARTFCRGANLKALMSLSDLPSVLAQVKPLFNKCFGQEFRGTLLSDLLARDSDGQPQEMAVYNSAKSQSLSSTTYAAFLGFLQQRQPNSFRAYLDNESTSQTLNPVSVEAEFVSEVVSHGATYATSSHHKGNSQVLVHTTRGTRRAGHIEEIFKHRQQYSGGHPVELQTKTEFFLAIRLWKDLDAKEQAKDPYRHYPLLEAALYETSSESELVVTSLDKIISHYASCPVPGSILSVTRDLQVILSLDRDGHLFLLDQTIPDSETS